MNIIKTDIEGVVIIEPRVFGDHRGYFFESFSQREFDERIQIVGKDGIKREVRFVQDNESKSCYGVLRGLHFQKAPHAQSKLVRVVKGAVLDKTKIKETFGITIPYWLDSLRVCVSNLKGEK